MDESVEVTEPVVDKAAEAREARRRRILENSSKRLEKITGRSAQEFEIENERIIYPDPDTEPILTEPPTLHRHGGQQQQQMPNLFPAMGDENMAHIMQSLLSNLGSAGGGGLGAGPREPQVEIPDNFVVKLIRTRIPIVVIALAVFLMFHSGRGHLLSNNVLISLFLWEAIELFLLKFYNKLNQKRSAITFVLVLFNVPQHLVDRSLTMLGMLHKIIQDFAVFMFIFGFLHYALGTPDGPRVN